MRTRGGSPQPRSAPGTPCPPAGGRSPPALQDSGSAEPAHAPRSHGAGGFADVQRAAGSHSALHMKDESPSHCKQSSQPCPAHPCPARGDAPPAAAPCFPGFPPTFWPQQGKQSPAAQLRKQIHSFSVAHRSGHPPRRGRRDRGVWRWVGEAAAAYGMCRAKWERG